MLRTEWKNDARVWEALLEDMPQTALVRNLGKMTAVGLLAEGSAASRKVAAQLVDATRLAGARVHPIAILSALRVYQQGHGERARLRANALSWTPVRAIVDALDEAFHLAFKSIEPTGAWALTKRDPLVLTRRDPLRDHKIQIGTRAMPRTACWSVQPRTGRRGVWSGAGGGRIRPPAMGDVVQIRGRRRRVGRVTRRGRRRRSRPRRGSAG
jgi:hypothetical protein